MALDDDIRILSGVGLFAGFTREQLRLMAFGAESTTLPAGRELYGEGAAAECAFVIISGSIVLFTLHAGERRIVARRGSGEILGELALISPGKRITGAYAETEVRLLRLNRGMFHRILEEFPDVARKLHQRISADLDAMIAQMERVVERLR